MPDQTSGAMKTFNQTEPSLDDELSVQLAIENLEDVVLGTHISHRAYRKFLVMIGHIVGQMKCTVVDIEEHH